MLMINFVTKKNVLCLLLAVCGMQHTLQAQWPVLEWAGQVGSGGSDNVYDVAADDTGNVYICGQFRNTADIDPGPGVSNLTATGQSDIYVAKLDPAGNLIWGSKLGGPNTDYAHAIATDRWGNVYTTGRFRDSLDFDPGPGTHFLKAPKRTPTASPTDNAFVSKLDASGNFVWAVSIGSTSGDTGEDIAVDADGNVYVTGYFVDTVDFDPGQGVHNLYAPGANEVFILKLNKDGQFVWARQLGGKTSDLAYGIALDDRANVHITGQFRDTVRVTTLTGNIELVSRGQADIFVAKMDSSGRFLWVSQMGGTSLDQGGEAISLDKHGNVYTTGRFRDTADFDPGSGNFLMYSLKVGSAFYNENVYVSKLDSNGAFVWAKSFGGPGTDWPMDISAATTGAAVYITGYFNDTADFDPDAGIYNMMSRGGQDAFAVRLDENGDFVWARQFGGTQTQTGRGIMIADSGILYVAGDFYDSVNFDPGPGVHPIQSRGDYDGFILKLKDCVNASAGDVITGPDSVCHATPAIFSVPLIYGADSFLWELPAGWSGSSTSETITVIPDRSSGVISVRAIGGCDTSGVITKHVYPLLPDRVQISPDGYDLQVTDNRYDSWQWFLNDTAIDGSVQATHTATENGDYYVVVTLRGCSDTSEAYTINNVSVTDMTYRINGSTVYPNPSGDMVYLGKQAERLTCYAADGRTVMYIENLSYFSVKSLPAGVYMLHITYGQGKQNIERLVVQP